MKVRNLVVLSLAAVLFCAYAGDIPKCDDEAVQKALKDEFLEGIGEAVDVLENLKISFSSFESERIDIENKVQYCKGQMITTIILDDENIENKIPLEYSVRYADNKDEVIVELAD